MVSRRWAATGLGRAGAACLRDGMSERQNMKATYEMADIEIHGAKQHNLKNIDVTIPRNSLTVVTGLSGSGKSSLAFDTLYAEGQRRYVESLSAYARQFLDQMEKPDVERIDGLSPAIAIEQRTTGGNPRSIVATVTEIHDYLRLLYGSVGVAHCPKCGREVVRQSAEQIVATISSFRSNFSAMRAAISASIPTISFPSLYSYGGKEALVAMVSTPFFVFSFFPPQPTRANTRRTASRSARILFACFILIPHFSIFSKLR